ncbi:hypothetical protein KAT80_03955 [Candidatus Pacearchaeota archaeon]|nr:hypothetical protein [Candidatus Pacearchaeota archaeon]
MKNKRGISIMIGYVLLVVFAMIMGTIVYKVIKTYVPKDVPECPESVSIFIKEINYTENSLKITMINNGLFDIAGYSIRATNSSSQEIATKDLSDFLRFSLEAKAINGVVIFLGGDNPMKPNDRQTQIFDLDKKIYSIEIIPVRFQEEDNKRKFLSCGGSKIREIVKISVEECIPESTATTCGTWVCGTRTNNCDEEINCGECSGEDVCNSTGQCVPPAECTDTCESLGYECGNHTICGNSTNCGDCLSEEICNATWQCEISCGNGDINPGEECDDGNTDDGDGCSSTCTIEVGWNCTGEPSICIYCDYDNICDGDEDCLCSDCENKKNGCEDGFACQSGECAPVTSVDSCKSYCYYLGYDDIASHCALNCGGACEGMCEAGGDQYCSSPTIYCCCIPQS